VTRKNVETEQNAIIELFKEGEFLKVVERGQAFTKQYPQYAIGWNLLALGYKNSGHRDKAQKLYEHLIEHNPNNALFLTNLANLYKEAGRIHDAVKCYQRALISDPDLLDTLDGLGLAFTELGELGKALECFKKIIELDKEQKLARYHLANIYRKLGRYQEAVAHFELTDIGLSKTHQLESIYLLGDKELFFDKFEKLAAGKKLNPLLGCLSSHAAVRYDSVVANSFCSKPFNCLQHVQIREEEGFTDDLVDQILDFHYSDKANYVGQPLLQNGQQSTGNLFLTNHSFVKPLTAMISAKIQEYRAKFRDSNEGFIKSWPDNARLFGWIVSMNKGGKLNSHIHKEGWLSGSLYLSVPDNINSNEGSIAFSLHGANYPRDGKQFPPEKVVRVKKGDICLFPSSLFHYTIPFKSEQERVSFAFDLIPNI
jgi:tetratricopeptide (TPR) repeat protein